MTFFFKLLLSSMSRMTFPWASASGASTTSNRNEQARLKITVDVLMVLTELAPTMSDWKLLFYDC